MLQFSMKFYLIHFFLYDDLQLNYALFRYEYVSDKSESDSVTVFMKSKLAKYIYF